MYVHQMYVGGRLVYADSVFNGYGTTKRDFLKQVCWRCINIIIITSSAYGAFVCVFFPYLLSLTLFSNTYISLNSDFLTITTSRSHSLTHTTIILKTSHSHSPHQTPPHRWRGVCKRPPGVTSSQQTTISTHTAEASTPPPSPGPIL